MRAKGEFTGSGDPAPTGTVTVSDGTRSCQASLSGSNGTATGSCQITEQSPGTYSFTASYLGEGKQPNPIFERRRIKPSWWSRLEPS